MKKIIGRVATLVGVFTPSSVNNDTLRAIQRDLNDEEKKKLDRLHFNADDMERRKQETYSGGDMDNKETQRVKS